MAEFEEKYRQIYQEFETDRLKFSDWIVESFGRNVDGFENILKNTAGFMVKRGINQRLKDYFEELRENGLSVGCLTNVENMFYPLFKDGGVYQGFDFCIASCKVKFRKPEQKIYEEIFKYGDWRPDEIVFVDDKPINVTKAIKLGFWGIVFENNGQLIDKLKELDVRLENED